MKILILIKRGGGGVGNAAFRLAKSLRSLGNEVDLFSREEKLKKGVIRSFFPLRNFIKRVGEKYDIILSNDWSLALPLIFPYKIYKKKHFCHFCGEQENVLIILQYLVYYLMKGRIIVNGDKLKKSFPNATLIYRGVDYKEFRPLGKKRSYIGMVKKESEVLTVEDIKYIAKKTGLKPIFAETIPAKKMNEFYNKCKVFVSLPPQGGFNNVWTESMAAGVPIVIGNNESIGKSWPFEKVNNDDPEILNKVIRIIKNPKKVDYRKWLIKKGISWENSAKMMINMFRSQMQKD